MKNEDQGLSILDIAPQVELVAVGDSKLKVYGISAESVMSLFQRFPQLQEWFRGTKVNVKEMIGEAPYAIAAVIAAGCGAPDNPEAEKKASQFGVETQLDVIEAIGRLTFKSGFGPFAQRIIALSAKAKSGNYGRGAVTSLPAESST